jgi:polo-like kinase 1
MTPQGQEGSARCFGSGTESAKNLGVVASAVSSTARVSQHSGGGSPELWVTKWVDYSSKYGVGYTLSDGSLGVYFNDSTKVILVGNRFDYITRRTQEKPEVRSSYSLDDYPEDLKKKVTLLRHFKNYMSADAPERKDGAIVGESGMPSDGHLVPPTFDPAQASFVKKWTRNKHAILFQLSNKIVQVMFFDKTEAVLSSKAHTVTYVDKRGNVCEYPLSSALDVPNAELSKRLRYTRDILVNLLGIRTTDLAAAAQ